MFESLTVTEAAILLDKLRAAYDRSMEIAQAVTFTARCTSNVSLKGACASIAHSEAALRSDLTAIRWQIKREALGYED